MLELGPGQAALDLEVGLGGAGEELLPPTAAGAGPPGEQLAPTKPPGRHLEQAGAGLVDGRDPWGCRGIQLEEMVGGPRRLLRIGEVGRSRPRHGNPLEPFRIGELERGPAGHHDPDARGAGHGDVRPPVDRHGMGVRVAHRDLDHKAARPGPQPEVHLVHEVPHPLPLVDAKARGAVGEPERDRVHRRAGQCRMPGGAEVPLDAAREPGVPQPEVGELEPVVVVEQLSTASLVPQRPEPAAEVQQHHGQEMVVLEGRDPGLLGHQVAGVVVLEQVGQHAGHGSVADVPCHLRVQPGAVDVVVQLPEKTQRRKRVQASSPRRGQDD